LDSKVHGFGISDSPWRAIALAIIALMLSGCMQATLAPMTEAGWSARDRQLMSNLPYAQATIPEEYRRHIVQYARKEAPGTIVVDTGNKFLYYVLSKGQAIRYGITVGEQGQAWSGIATVGRKEEWPSWTPTGRKIRWVRAGYICIPVARTRSTVSTAPTSPNISAEPSPPAASA
jgi:lipoprotein-anchoring transpeptidase ErfK/SrfK